MPTQTDTDTARALSPEARRDLDRVARLERVAWRMDRAFQVPGTHIRFGLDAVLGLIPVIGDTATLLPALYILAVARRMGAPLRLLATMIWTVAVDWLIGLVPFAGDIFDVGYKANSQNARKLRAHVEARHGLAPGPDITPRP